MARERPPDPLETYHRKRDFERTPEPAGQVLAGSGRSFVIQKHAARRLHYDFRLELDGVLLSWAVPKGPSLSPSTKRLAVQTEDHPLEYGTFEGIIPRGEYGGGTVMVWDRGTWEPIGDARKGYERGRLKFRLHGHKLRGVWNLVRTRGRGGQGGDEDRSWLLIKSDDAAADRRGGDAFVEREPTSALTGRTMEEIAADPDRVWHSSEGAGDATIPAVDAVSGARRADLPEALEPQLATLVKDAPAGDHWLHEIKLDGYRLLARIDRGRVTMLTRRGLDWSDRMPSITRVLAALPVERAILDGELVVLGANGVSDFQALQNALGAGDDAACVYYAFDLLYLGEHDLRAVPLERRKEILERLLRAVGAGEGRIRYGDHVVGSGPEFYRQACEIGLEGTIAKAKASRYQGGRSKTWLKIRCSGRQEFVVGGWSDPGGSRPYFGALLIGTFDAEGRLRYAGKVGTGFTEQSLADVHTRLLPLAQAHSAFVDPPRGAEARGVHWVRPELVAEVEFTEMTRAGSLRHPSFKGLRQDKVAADVALERPEGGSAPVPRARRKGAGAGRGDAPTSTSAGAGKAGAGQVRLSNPDRVLYPGMGVTKRELASYYAQVADWILPHLGRRPLTLVRCPSGRHADCFYQKHLTPGMPERILPVELEEDGELQTYMYVEDLAGILGLVQMGVLELHVWGSRVDDLERPDMLVFDLDPDTELGWSRVVDGAFEVRRRLAELGLESFVKTTGGKGLHVVVPIEPRLAWDQAKAFCQAVARDLVARHPGRFVATMTKSRRRGRIFVDYLRNGRNATAIVAYSTRRHPHAPVSTPLTWDELGPAIRADHFDVRNLPRRLGALAADPWAGYFEVRQTITDAMLEEVRIELPRTP